MNISFKVFSLMTRLEIGPIADHLLVKLFYLLTIGQLLGWTFKL